MAELSQMGIPGIGFSGILHPKLVNRFRARFIADQDFSILSMQTVSVQGPVQTRSGHGSIYVKIQDDVSGHALKALQQLWNCPEFTVVIEHLDGNIGVTGTYTLSKCTVDTIEHGDLDYAGGRSYSPRLTFSTKEWIGTDIDELAAHPATAAAVKLLNGTTMTFQDESMMGAACVEHLAMIHYEQLEIS